MSKHIQLTLPEPCHENWNNMTPVEKGRFCKACQKQVVDFTGMSDAQVATFFKKTSNSVCGRFMNDQLNRDLEIPKKRIPWLKYFFTVVLPAFLFSAKAKAQGNVRVITGDTVIAPLKGKVNIQTNKTLELENKVITGKVTDIEGKPVSGATIAVKGTTMATASNASGDFKVTYKGNTTSIILETSCVGFETVETTANLNDKNEIIIGMARMSYQLSGEVIVIAGLVVPKKKKEIPLIPQKLLDTASQHFKVFPNPVSSGTNLNIEIARKIKEGYYILDILYQSGQSLYQREIWIDAEAGIVNLTIPAIKPGSYYLRLVHKKSKKRFADKLIIQ